MKQHSKSPKHKKNNKVLFRKLLKIKDDGVHYSCNKFYSYPEVFLGIIDGGRGIGKTTTFLKKGILNCDKGEEFIYMRRYKPEIKKFVNKDSISPLIDGCRYVGDGAGGYTLKYEDRVMGYLIALATSRSYKSVDFSRVTLIIYDEGIVRQTASYRYLTDEPILLLEFISTVQRTRTNLKVVILGNNEDMISPFHSYFNIPNFELIYLNKERGLYCEHAKNSEALLEEEKKTGLFKLIQGTAYGDYHYDNQILTNELVEVIDKPAGTKLQFRIIVNKFTMNLYSYSNSKNDSYLYCELKEKVIKDNIAYEIINDGKFNYLDVNLFKRKVKNYLYDYYFNKRVTFNDNKGGAMLSWVIENT